MNSLRCFQLAGKSDLETCTNRIQFIPRVLESSSRPQLCTAQHSAQLSLPDAAFCTI